MKPLTILASAILCTAAVLPAQAQNTYVVDANGAQPFDFLTIQAGIDFAQPGDRILIRPANYGGFLLTKGLVLLGSKPGVTVGASRVTNVPTGQLAALALLDFTGFAPPSGFNPATSLSIEDNVGAVVLDAVRHPGGSYFGNSTLVRVSNSADVRMLRVTLNGSAFEQQLAMSSQESKLDVVESSFQSGNGAWGEAWEWGGCVDGGPGSAGIAANGGLLHLSLTDATGGAGGSIAGDFCDYCWPIPWPGPASPGLWAGGGALVHLVGTGHIIRAGAAGSGWLCGNGYGSGGIKLYGTGTQTRYSNVSIVPAGGAGGTPPPIELFTGATATEAASDPALTITENVPSAGGQVRYVVYGQPGDQVTLFLARGPARIPVPGVVVEQLTSEDYRPLAIGTVAPSGNVTHLRYLPPGMQPGSLLFAQAKVMRGGAELRTNSVAFVVRH